MICISLLPGAIAELFAHASESRVITLADRYGLMAALLEDNLSRDEHDSINRLLRALQRGTYQTVDELSSLATAY